MMHRPAHTLLRNIAGFAVFLFGGGLPALFAVILWRHKASLKTEATFGKFGFLYDGYSIDRGLFYWESVTMMRKAAVVAIGSLIKDGYQQIVFAIALMTVSLALQASYNPYMSPRLNRMEVTSLMGILATQLIALFYLRADAQAADCIGADPDIVVDDVGTQCSTIMERKQRQEVLVTAVLVILNLTIMLGFGAVLVRTCWKDGRRYIATAMSDDDDDALKGTRKGLIC